FDDPVVSRVGQPEVSRGVERELARVVHAGGRGRWKRGREPGLAYDLAGGHPVAEERHRMQLTRCGPRDELQDTVVPAVRHPEVAGGVERDVRRVVEGRCAGPGGVGVELALTD